MKRLLMLAGLTCMTAQGQWSIGPGGKHDAAPGKHRIVFLAFASPVPGQEVQFNDWYTNTHMGDLVQLDGWVGAQRFRIVPGITPRLSTAGWLHGYVIIWDLEDADGAAALARLGTAMQGGKSRRGPAFNYTPGTGSRGYYEILGPRITRPDGKGTAMPASSDNKSIRPNRYILMELSNALPGKDAEFDKAANETVQGVLKLPGWLAAQRYRAFDPPAYAARDKPKYLTIYEGEGATAQALHDAWTQALKSGAIKKNPAMDEATAEIVYWEPITPYVTKEDFAR